MRVLLVGDTHGNVSWLERVVFPAVAELGADVILQVGDFGWWPRAIGDDAFIDVARSAPVPLWWIDGNHEDHDRLAAAVAEASGPDARGLVNLGGNLAYLPRGTRLDLDGVFVVVCGGAHSIDRRSRSVGVSWFAAEHVGDADIERAVADGHADILITHDAPAGWRIPNLPSDGVLPWIWQVELPSCEEHRRRLEEIMGAVTPSLIVHGHYHSGYRRALDLGWGPVDVVGLSEDGTNHNLAVLDCTTGAWTIAPLVLS